MYVFTQNSLLFDIWLYAANLEKHSSKIFIFKREKRKFWTKKTPQTLNSWGSAAQSISFGMIMLVWFWGNVLTTCITILTTFSLLFPKADTRVCVCVCIGFFLSLYLWCINDCVYKCDSLEIFGVVQLALTASAVWSISLEVLEERKSLYTWGFRCW